jgi:hypothetical protein
LEDLKIYGAEIDFVDGHIFARFSTPDEAMYILQNVRNPKFKLRMVSYDEY